MIRRLLQSDDPRSSARVHWYGVGIGGVGMSDFKRSHP
jgi:hypothetical protein